MARQPDDRIYPKSFFDRPPKKARGIETPDEIFLWVGRALTRWEYLETVLADLLIVLAGTNNKAAARIYGSMFSSSNRREAVAMAAEVFLTHHHVKDKYGPTLKELLSHHGRASKWRDEIAHGV